MALQINIAKSDLGIALPAAYARIINVHSDKTNVRVVVAIYFNAAARGDEARPVEQRLYTFKLADLKGDLFPAVYAALKALPDFAGALDV